jgi:hypothetical protein
MTEKTVKLIRRGFRGWHAKGVTSGGHIYTSEGGDIEPRYHGPSDSTVAGYVQEAEDGCPVIDCEHYRGAEDERDFLTWVFKGPEPNPLLPTGTMRMWGDVPFDSYSVSPMTQVSIEDFLALAKVRIPRAHFGRVRGGKIEWEDLG